MKKTVWIFGTVLGAILIGGALCMVHQLYRNPDMETNDLLGYAMMVVIYSLLFFGVRNYRNRYLGGFISFGKAFRAGLWITLVASTVYVVVWLFYYYLVVPDWMDVYVSYVLSHTPASELTVKTKEMNDMREMYKSPFFVIIITYAEVLPVGLVVSLLSALLLKRKNKAVQPAGS